MASLHELLSVFSELEEALAETGGELTPELEGKLSLITSDLNKKVDYLAFIVERVPTVVEFYRAQSDKYAKMARSLTSLSDNVKDNVRLGLETQGRSELVGSEFSFKLSAPRESVDVLDVNLIPRDLCSVSYKPNRELIKESIHSGNTVPGVRLVSRRPVTVKPTRKALK